MYPTLVVLAAASAPHAQATSAFAAGPAFAIHVEDRSPADSVLSRDEVTSFAASSGPLRFTNFRVVTVATMAAGHGFGGGVIVGDGELAAYGLVDTVDRLGRPVAMDRLGAVTVRSGAATLAFFDGPSYRWDGVKSPATDAGGGRIAIRALDETDDAVSSRPDAVQKLVVALKRPDGTPVTITRLSLDTRRHGGVLVDRGVWIWGFCDVSVGTRVVRNVPLSVVAARGVVRLRLDGLIDVLAPGAISK